MRTPALIGAGLAAILAYGGFAARVSPIMDYDPAIGFLVWKSMESGSPFNRLRSASHTDLAGDDTPFMATYSPGQYLIPVGLTVFGISLSAAIWLTMFLSGAVGLVAYYFLFRVFEFPSWIASVSCVFLLFTRPVGALFFEYSGGTLLEFAGMPLMILATVFCLRHRTVWRLALPLIFAAGAFLKLSMAVLALALCLYAVMTDLFDESRTRNQRLLRAGAALAGFVLFYAAMGALYTSKGWTAASSQRVGGIKFSTLFFSGLYSVASLNAAITSFFSMLPPLKAPLDPASLTNSSLALSTYVPMLGALSLFSIAMIVWCVRRRFAFAYSKLLIATAFIYVAAMTSIYARGGAALEFRHFWIVGALLVPALIQRVAESGRGMQTAAVVLGTAVCFFGIASTGERILQDTRAVAAGDFSVPREETEIADLVRTVEAGRAQDRPVLFANDPRVALLVKKSRLAFTPGAHFDSNGYRGSVGSLILLIETRQILEKTTPRITAMFPDMSNWRTAVVGPFTVLVAGPDSPPGALAGRLRPL